MKDNEEMKRWIYRLIIVLLIGLILAGTILFLQYTGPFFRLFFKVLTPFLFAGFIIYLLHPVVEKLEKANIPRPLSIFIIFSLFLVLTVAGLLKASPYIIEEGRELLTQLPELAGTYREFTVEFTNQAAFLPDTFQQRMDNWISRGEGWVAGALEELGAALVSLLDWALLLIVIPFIVFYGLKDFPLLKNTSWYLTPKKMRRNGKQLIMAVDQTLGSYIRGQLIVCIVVGLLAWGAFWVIDMPYGTLLAIFIGVTNIIPYFGPILGAVPVILLALTESFQLVLLGIAAVFIIQIVEGNILAPVIVGKSIHTHPLLIIFALVIGNEMGGIIGLILAVPVLAVLKVLLLHSRKIVRERRGIYD
ncbi:AI-2E family transporter [Salipaludibacillus sp. CUR1]|uniref:AI-2E family transporter n=1 Tax=Salipaludibacillus sp. CUR1 TaxID=2820003 RepID=UPI001E4FCE5A|nr:AI-2E family transporter [Salipaludibacillus sp. CUR1]